jgi:hypothetical protein
MARPAPLGPVSSAEQLYVTHCTRQDSVLGQEGFGVRAASSADPALLRFALELPAHELPAEMWSQRPTAAQAPRRLARIALTDGRVALVHSTYLPFDTHGRDGNYFTHILVYESLAPAAALRSWASPRWQTDYPAGAPKELPRFEGVPAGGPIDDAALATFLDPAAALPGGADLETLFPERVRTTNPRRRRDWLRLTLAAGLRALAEAAGPTPALALRAEPGLLALLLYGVVRLLPEHLTRGLTFSTYECPGEALRRCRHAIVIGTYTPAPAWSDDHLRSGIALDLWREPPAPLPGSDSVAGLDYLVSLAAAGGWVTLGEVHAIWARGAAPAAATLVDAASIQPALRRLRSGLTALADASELARSPLGREFLEELAATLFPLVWTHCLEDERGVALFGDFLRRRRRDLEASLAEAIASGSGPPWSRQWALLRRLFSAAEAANSFRRVLGRVRGTEGWQRFPMETRLALLRAWAEADSAEFLPPEDADLLASSCKDDLAELVGALPPRWAGQALCGALAAGGRTEEVDALLESNPGGPAAGFCEAARTVYGTKADKLLAPLLPPKSRAAVATFARLQAAGLALEADVLRRLLEQAGGAKRLWLQYWFDGDNLVWLGRALPPDNPLLGRIWQAYTNRIDEDFLRGDRKQEYLVRRLETVRDALEGRVPAAAAASLVNWRRLYEQQHAPPPDPGLTSGRRERRLLLGLVLVMLLLGVLLGGLVGLTLR